MDEKYLQIVFCYWELVTLQMSFFLIQERSSDESHFEIDVSITEYGMKTLENFSQKSVDISVIDAHSVLSDMIKGFRQVNMHKGSHTDWTWWITSILQVSIHIITMLSL